MRLGPYLRNLSLSQTLRDVYLYFLLGVLSLICETQALNPWSADLFLCREVIFFQVR